MCKNVTDCMAIFANEVVVSKATMHTCKNHKFILEAISDTGLL